MERELRYHLFIDESGDHGLVTVNPDFPVFLLCGVLIAENEYQIVQGRINSLKDTFWNGKHVILHSRDIRKCEKEFSVLFDLEKKGLFYQSLNSIMSEHDYVIIASAIKKDLYIKQYGRLTTNDVYELALSFIIERTIFYLDDISGEKKLDIAIEQRGKREDKKLDEHFQRLMARGTGYIQSHLLRNYQLSISFHNKRENIVGLQLSDLVAYPLARYVMDPERANPAFDLIESKIYSKKGNRYGLKIFP